MSVGGVRFLKMKLPCVGGPSGNRTGGTMGLIFPHGEKLSFPECCDACFVPAAGDGREDRRGAAMKRQAGSSQVEKGLGQSANSHA